MSGVSYAQSPRVQELSAAMFGQRHRLAVMAAIAQSDGMINPSELVEALGFRAQSSIQKALTSLVETHLVTRISVHGRVYYKREPSAAWDFALELLAKALADDPALHTGGQ
ncbi:ArsR family transcriptional regulator [Mycobacterium sp. MFM001]|uniref:ArsR family transcriptional regulator n=1 Tax=Mycobacterium sp. MFM001 TaxID=2049453 RepID=UPI001863C9BC|nr:ArsR family transcriptional regulator [Mycobacterium sp. MFM001]